MASFPQFRSFPLELQLAIWELAIPDPEPEVCFAWPLAIPENVSSPEEPALPFVVDMAWPAVARVCRAARKAVLTSGAVRLRHSPTAGFAVPCRRFIPAIDTLYVGRHQAGSVFSFLGQPDNAPLARDLRHLSVELSALGPYTSLATLIRRSAIYLRTLTVVFSGTAGDAPATASFLPPARRCKLCDISDETLAGMNVIEIPIFKSSGATGPWCAHPGARGSGSLHACFLTTTESRWTATWFARLSRGPKGAAQVDESSINVPFPT